MFGLEMATELIPYKGFSVILNYITVPLYQLLLGSFLPYRGILIFFTFMSLIAMGIAYYFYKNIRY